MQVTPEEFISVAQETKADAILMSSLYGMAELDLKDFNKKRMEAGLQDILLYIGGNLVIGRYDPKDIEPKFKALGFDRVYPPGTEPEIGIEDLKKDLTAKRENVKMICHCESFHRRTRQSLSMTWMANEIATSLHSSQ